MIAEELYKKPSEHPHPLFSLPKVGTVISKSPLDVHTLDLLLVVAVQIFFQSFPIAFDTSVLFFISIPFPHPLGVKRFFLSRSFFCCYEIKNQQIFLYLPIETIVTCALGVVSHALEHAVKLSAMTLIS